MCCPGLTLLAMGPVSGCRTSTGDFFASCVAHLLHCRKLADITLWSKTDFANQSDCRKLGFCLKMHPAVLCLRLPDPEFWQGILPGQERSGRHKCRVTCLGPSARPVAAAPPCPVSIPCLPRRPLQQFPAGPRSSQKRWKELREDPSGSPGRRRPGSSGPFRQCRAGADATDRRRFPSVRPGSWPVPSVREVQQAWCSCCHHRKPGENLAPPSACAR